MSIGEQVGLHMQRHHRRLATTTLTGVDVNYARLLQGRKWVTRDAIPPHEAVDAGDRNVSKRFPGVRALHDVSFAVERGEVHALIGENGAGKSTLMKLLSGVYPDYEGELLLDGQPLALASPRDAQHRGIAIIHQELNLIPELTVAENIFLGREPRTAAGLLDVTPHGAGVTGTPRAAQPAHPTRPANQVAAGRRAAARRSRQGALARRPAAHPGRADLGAESGGDRAPLRGGRRPEGARRHHDLHLAQAGRDLPHRRPRHRPARWGVHRNPPDRRGRPPCG